MVRKKTRKIIVLIFIINILLFKGPSISNAHITIEETDFYEIFDNHGSIMLIIDPENGTIDYANKVATDFYGYSIDQLKSMNIQDLNILTSDEINREIQLAINERRNYNIFKHRLFNGDVRTVAVYSSPYNLSENTILLLTINDITIQTQLQEKNRFMAKAIIVGLSIAIVFLMIFIFLLIRSFRNLKARNHEINNFNLLRKTFIDADNSLIYLKDERLKYIFVNKAVESFLNKDSTEIVGLDDFELLGNDYAHISKRTDDYVLKKRSGVITKIKYQNKIYQATKFPVLLLNNDYGVGAYVKDITDEYNNKKALLDTNIALNERDEKLQLILDSTYEGIYGIDIQGLCTFCNRGGLKLLGYKHQEDVIGKSIHSLIHHSCKDGSPSHLKDCRILKIIKDGQGVHVDNELFWRADGTCFDVEYFSFPQLRNGEIIGAVVTFIDITSRKKQENDIAYLSYHDSLTGLYNRRYFDEELKRLDVERNLPLSIIMGDANGLKITNDIFGHAAGDILLKKAAEVMKSVCRSDDIIARWGGDEFIIILPKTKYEEAEKIANRIKIQFSKEQIKTFNGSISLGYNTKSQKNQDIQEVVEEAEQQMYFEKTLDSKNIKNNTIETILKALYNKFPEEADHALRVSNLCKMIGRKMDLTESELSRLENAAYLHDIGKIVIDESVLDNFDSENIKEIQKIKQHPVVGYRILNATDDALKVAEIILAHHERWDGSGYPKGLKGEAIPKLARIIALAESYDSMTTDWKNRKSITKEEAILELQRNSDSQFDPEITKTFIDVLREENN